MSVFNTFPTKREWVALFIGVLAFLMATPPIIQMIWGRPKVEIEFAKEETPSGRVLKCEEFNRPVGNRFLRAIGVCRHPVEDLNVGYQIHEAGSNTVVRRFVQP